MGQLKVFIRDHTGSKNTPVELPDDVQMNRLISALVSKLGLPNSQNGQPINYALDNARTGKRLGNEDTLASAGCQTDDILTLLPNVTAGMAPATPRLRRLQSDYERLQKLASQSEFIQIVRTEGTPPELYVIEFTCRGIERVNNDKPVYRDYFQMAVKFPSGYPTEKPGLAFNVESTPIFHPNINPHQGTVCIGDWWAAKSLDELVFMVAEMIQYKIPPTRDTAENVLDSTAVTWLQSHRNLLPVDKRDIRMRDVAGEIRIGDAIAPSDDFEIKLL